MWILGITGGIATGKSTVTKMLADCGAPTISADVLAHNLLQPGTETTQAVLHAFPSCTDPNDACGLTLDRRALGQLVFADPGARKKLEALTHPAIIARLAEQIETWRRDFPGVLAAAEIPLLFEAGLEHLVDRIVVVACKPETQIQRLAARLDGDLAEAKNRVASQWPLENKLSHADDIIQTDDGLESTQRQVQALFDALSAQQV